MAAEPGSSSAASYMLFDRESGNAISGYTVADEARDAPVRPWPTMRNLENAGLIEEAEWLGPDDGWLWRLTDAGKAYMRTVVEARRGR